MKTHAFVTVLICSVLAAVPARGELGDLLTSFDYQVSRFQMHPDLPRVYASVLDTNSVVAIDTDTLEVVSSTVVGTNPGGMALSNDGSQLYVASNGSDFVSIVDTASGALIDSLAVGEFSRDVEVGADGRLYVLGTDSLMQWDPTTGNSAGANIGPYWMVRSGEIAISPSKDRLYYADYGISPASLYQYDVTSEPANLLWESPHGGTSGSNGQDLAISHDGTFISYAAGYGQGGYKIAKYSTSDMLIEGTFDTGAYPREITFSPDDAFAYTVSTAGAIDIWDTDTFAKLDTISVSNEAYEMQVDASGAYLFAAFGGFSSPSSLRIYDVGVVPEPASCGLFVVGLALASVVARRRRA